MWWCKGKVLGQRRCTSDRNSASWLLASLQPSIHSPGSNGHKNPGGFEESTIAQAWGCASNNKEPSVSNSCSVTESHRSLLYLRQGLVEKKIVCDRLREDEITVN